MPLLDIMQKPNKFPQSPFPLATFFGGVLCIFNLLGIFTVFSFPSMPVFGALPLPFSVQTQTYSQKTPAIPFRGFHGIFYGSFTSPPENIPSVLFGTLLVVSWINPPSAAKFRTFHRFSSPYFIRTFLCNLKCV